MISCIVVPINQDKPDSGADVSSWRLYRCHGMGHLPSTKVPAEVTKVVNLVVTMAAMIRITMTRTMTMKIYAKTSEQGRQSHARKTDNCSRLTSSRRRTAPSRSRIEASRASFSR